MQNEATEKHRKITLEISDTAYGPLQVLHEQGNVEDVVSQSIDHANKASMGPAHGNATG